MKLYQLFEAMEEPLNRYGAYGAWISPKNKVHDIEAYGHSNFAVKRGLCDMYTSRDQEKLVQYSAYYGPMCKGWVRITHNKPDSIAVEGRQEDIKRVWPILARSFDKDDVDRVDIDMHSNFLHNQSRDDIITKEGGFNLPRDKLKLQNFVFGTRLIEAVNTECFRRGFKKTKNVLGGEYNLIATHGMIPYHPKKKLDASDQFRIEAYQKNSMVGWVNFEKVDDHIEAIDVVINKEHRRKGIATEMYTFARELGNTVVPSSKQTSLGKKFWGEHNTQVVKEAMEEPLNRYGAYGAWISPKNKVIEVPKYQSHEEVAIKSKIYKRPKEEEPVLNALIQFDLYLDLMSKGWVRVAHDKPDVLDIEGRSQDLARAWPLIARSVNREDVSEVNFDVYPNFPPNVLIKDVYGKGKDAYFLLPQDKFDLQTFVSSLG